MKETFGYPKTLRNYPEQPSKSNNFLGPLNNSKSYKSFSTYNSKKTVEEQEHNVGDYYVLTNPSIVKEKSPKVKKSKKKTKSKQSHLSQALRQQKNKAMFSYNQVGPQNILHCKSLQKLQIISNDRSEEIKVLINEKGFLMAQNEDLRAKLTNPTYREQDFVQKIAEREFQIENLKQTLKRKDQMMSDMEKDYKLEIERLKVKHREEMASLREEMNKIRLEKASDSPKKYVTATTNYNTTNERTYKPETYKPEVTYSTYNPVAETKPSYSINTNTNVHRISLDRQALAPTPVHSVQYGNSNYKVSSSNTLASKSPQKIITETSNLPYKTYVGEDGYERRVYTQQTVELLDNIKTANRYSNPGTTQYIGSPFTNQKITTYVGKQPSSSSNLYKYSDAGLKNEVQTEKSSIKYDSGQHNQNLYSKSLTFQCFNEY